ncbi:MAG: tRNA uridine-5-carboxymethylaminomethyl(34) synthesis enzyme MnmG [Synergistales bacterium]
MKERYEIIVVGAGHAGCEAALAAARMGCSTLLLNLYIDNMALMACNPSIGGPAKGHLVREIDALGGQQALATDASTLHLRWLNTSKGPAVRTLRAQCDTKAYHAAYLNAVENTDNLDLFQDIVTEIVVSNGRIRGVKTRLGLFFEASSVILATGTYLGGRVHVGLVNFPSGPLGQMPASDLTESLRRAGFEAGRLKTGTTPRIHAASVDWKSLVPQESAAEPLAFSHWKAPRVHVGHACYQTRTTPKTHDIIRGALDRSPLFTGVIEGVGPRYCPSIEDRVVRFPDRDSHIVFLEPVGGQTAEIYMQNFSTSLPFDVQVEMVRSLPGCENARFLRPGYAIEYDFLPPTQLYPWLETRVVRGLFCAGQINGTSGYEEAAAQGLLAGINAARLLQNGEPVVLGRGEAYMGVLVDDLVTKGTQEPYRMFTSRCEHRLILRHDNADRRLAPIGRTLGLLGDDRWGALMARWEAMDAEKSRLDGLRVFPTPENNALLEKAGTVPLDVPVPAMELLRRPEVTWEVLQSMLDAPSPLAAEEAASLATEVKYAGYIEREQRTVQRLERTEKVRIPEDFDYAAVTGLSAESRVKLARMRPLTLGQAGRISGVTPADVQILWVAVKAHHERQPKAG